MASDSVLLSCASYTQAEFNIVSMLEFRANISVAVEHCLLCGGSRRTFYCRDCITSGNFQHSTLNPSESASATGFKEPHSYAEKYEQWKTAKEELPKAFTSFREQISEQQRYRQKRAQAKLRKERIEEMKSAIANAKYQIAQGETELKKLRDSNKTISQQTSRVCHKINKISSHLKTCSEELSQSSRNLEQTSDALVHIRQKHIADLVKYIFSIETVQQKSEFDMQMKTRVSLLAEARHTAYVKGRWVRGDSEWEDMYRIVGPVLPGNGDYALHCPLVERSDSTQQSTIELTRRNDSLTIIAGLCLATQLVRLLSEFLDINLPWNLHFMEFCLSEMTAKQFNTAVFKLNCNVVYLCITQGVNLEGLHPQHTICNVRALLDHPELGSGIASNDTELMHAIEDSVLSIGMELDLSDSIDITERDWEHVPVSLPEVEVMPPQGTTSSGYFATMLPAPHRTGQETQSTMSSIAGGLVSSAMASIWRWGKSDK